MTELAELSKCSASLISAIERGTANPSFITVKAITEALGVHPSEILIDNSVSQDGSGGIATVVRRDERKIMIMGDVRVELLSRGGNIPFEFMCTEFKPGVSTEKLLTHEGAECFVVLEGELQVHFADREFHLRAGDSISFSSNISHKVSNLGKKKAVAYWVNSVPWLFSTK